MNKFILVLVILASTVSSTFASPILSGPSGISTGYNKTTKQIEIIPQCFPYLSLSEYDGMFTFPKALINQDKCRTQRSIDF